MELRQLNYFFEVAKQKSISKAATTLHLSQPALSKMLKNLEQELGMTLLIRTNKTSELTDAGMVVFEYAKKINNELANMSTILNDLTELKRGEIHFGLPPIIGSLFFPNILAAFHKTYPNITIKITEYGGAKIVKSVQEGELDLAVTVLPVNEELFDSYPIVNETMKVIVHHDHALANRDVVDLSELKDEEFIFYHEDFSLHDLIWKKFLQAGYEPNIVFKSSQWDLMSEMVVANLGITILPKSICQRVKSDSIRVLDLTPEIPWNLAVIKKREKYLSFAGRTFIEFIR
ncbi:putative HTH-type transcriptional regulator YwbI [Paraliobacillus quinghaiensis]|uniref:HTH-type transcriptional regulator YwbI n=1 Tax=Paraliobacillus quinghaiensis TaxID=470815 RepID=A0A917WWY7_9BACI|nr:LysR family transcriptional regulator [Paraliobacillus quinghaiensis]GGM35700.1 putative HTH-type transcriptional regulator YwbI [Paraliobacillus quinghaiensis]